MSPGPNDEKHQTFRTINTLLAKAMDVAAAMNLPQSQPRPKPDINLRSIVNESAVAESESQRALALRLAADVAAEMTVNSELPKQGLEPHLTQAYRD
jgi:hypothetical protein